MMAPGGLLQNPTMGSSLSVKVGDGTFLKKLYLSWPKYGTLISLYEFPFRKGHVMQMFTL